MSAPLTASVIFVCMLCGMALGSYLRLVLPDDHTQADSKDIVMTSAGMMSMLAALIIGLLVTCILLLGILALRLAAESRGVKPQRYLVLKSTCSPAVLVEVGFLSNFTDRSHLADPGYRTRVAMAIAGGIL